MTIYVSERAYPETLRTLAYTGISGSYATVGSVLSQPSHMVRIINSTNGDMFFSLDGSNNHFFVPATSFVLYDITSNHDPSHNFKFAKGTQFYVKQSSAASSGSVHIESIFGS